MIALLLLVLGLVLGSFVNAFVWRFHEGKDWVNGRSECVHCHHKLGPLDLVPLFSWLVLRGKCRYCHKKIDDNPLVEAILPVLFVISYVYWPVPLHADGLITFILWLVLLTGFMILTIYDLRWMLLPDKVVFPLIVIAAVNVLIVAIYHADIQNIVDAVLGVIVVSGIFYLLHKISKGAWIGFGDVKLGLVLGLLSGGLLPSFLLLFVASVAGTLASLPLLVKGKATRKTQLPFGPFLIIGLVFVKLFGAAIINWYTNLLA